MTATEVVTRWLRLIMEDAELSPYLIGVDLDRLAAHLTASLARVLDGEPAAADGWRGLGLSEAQHLRVVAYLVGVLWASDLPEQRIAEVRRAFEVNA
ncbi:hypothetical protein [Micromonospora vulcania]|uniref:Uncharacterized protein n=1 Tax=Micromonospora vulcania TaxID=1441873 RepID=A0ABW1H5T5_9ACTN